MAGRKIDRAKRLKDLEHENDRLKKTASELTLDKLILKEAYWEILSPFRKRACVDHVRSQLIVSEVWLSSYATLLVDEGWHVNVKRVSPRSFSPVTICLPLSAPDCPLPWR